LSTNWNNSSRYGQSRSTLQNYIRRIALFVIHFGKLPKKIDSEEINEYLAALARVSRSPSLQDRGTFTPLQEKVFAKIALC
jgi:hypothetical protein